MANIKELQREEEFISFLRPHINNAESIQYSRFEAQLVKSLESVTAKLNRLTKIRNALDSAINRNPKIRVQISSQDYMEAVRVSEDTYEIVTDNYVILKEGDDE